MDSEQLVKNLLADKNCYTCFYGLKKILHCDLGKLSFDQTCDTYIKKYKYKDMIGNEKR